MHFKKLVLLSILICSQPILGASVEAYASQNLWVSNQIASHNQEIIGFKAGLTSSKSQKKFNTTLPIAGVLFKSSELTDHTIQLENFKKPHFEAELGFILAHDITEPLPPSPDMTSYVSTIIPVVEFPDLGNIKAPITADHIVEANAAAAYILRLPHEFDKNSNINKIPVNIIRKGQILSYKHTNAAMGDQWKALHWLINQLIYQGYELKQGQLLITGAIGKMIPATPGKVSITYGKYSFSLHFEEPLEEIPDPKPLTDN